jgi:hypothetical protein
MNFDKWAERIYSETDFGRSIATSIAAGMGLIIYLIFADWVIAVFSSIIIFPIARHIFVSYHEKIKKAAERYEREKEIEDTYSRLSKDEKNVVNAFVTNGSCVMTWGQYNKEVHSLAIESLKQRGLAYDSMTSDGFSETFIIDEQLFDVAQKKIEDF